MHHLWRHLAVLMRQVGRRVSRAEAAIAASDASMCKGLHRVSQFPEWPVQDMTDGTGRLDAGDFRNWKWRDHAVRSSGRVS